VINFLNCPIEQFKIQYLQIISTDLSYIDFQKYNFIKKLEESKQFLY